MVKSALITGAGRGLGKGFVEYFLENGYQVFAGVRNTPATELKENDNLKIIPLDVENNDSIENAYKIVSGITDKLDYLINNAGLNKDTATNNNKDLVTKLTKLDRKILLEMFNVNTISPIMMVKKFIALLKSDPSFIINISSNRASFADSTNTSGNYGYRASKAALNMMTLASLYDLPQNVKTFAVHPGNVKTDMNPEGSQSPRVQAEKIVGITLNWNDKNNGKFLKPDGSQYSL